MSVFKVCKFAYIKMEMFYQNIIWGKLKEGSYMHDLTLELITCTGLIKSKII